MDTRDLDCNCTDDWEFRIGTDSLVAGSIGLQFLVILLVVLCCYCYKYKRSRRERRYRSHSPIDSSVKYKAKEGDKLELVVKRKSIEPLDDNYSVVKIRGAYDLLKKVDEGNQTAPGFLGNPTYMSNYSRLGDISGSYSESNKVGGEAHAVYCRLNEDCTHSHSKPEDLPAQSFNHPLSRQNRYERDVAPTQNAGFTQDRAGNDDDIPDGNSEAHYSTVSIQSRRSIYSLAQSPNNSSTIASPAEYEDFYTIPETRVEEANSSSDSEQECQLDVHKNSHEGKKKGSPYGNIGAILKQSLPATQPKPQRPMSAMDPVPSHQGLKRTATNQYC